MNNTIEHTTIAVSCEAYGFYCTLGKIDVTNAVARVTEALKVEDFGVLTGIDVQATMKAKLNVGARP